MALVDPYRDILVKYGTVVDLNANTAAFPSATTGFDMTGFEHALIIVGVGVTAATCDVACGTSATTNGTYAAVTGATMTLIGTDDSKVYVGVIKMSAANPFLRVTPTVSAASHLGAIFVCGVNPRITPVTQEVTTAAKTFNVTA